MRCPVCQGKVRVWQRRGWWLGFRYHRGCLEEAHRLALEFEERVLRDREGMRRARG